MMWPQLLGQLQQAVAQVLELAQSGGGHGDSAPAAGRAVKHGVKHGPRDARHIVCAWQNGHYQHLRRHPPVASQQP